MPKVANLTPEGITIMRWRLLPKSRVAIDPNGRRMEDLPAYIAYSDQAKALADRGVLRIEGYRPPAPVDDTTTDTTPPSDTVVITPVKRDKKSRKWER